MTDPWANRDYLRGTRYKMARPFFPRTADGYYAITGHSGCLVCEVG